MVQGRLEIPLEKKVGLEVSRKMCPECQNVSRVPKCVQRFAEKMCPGCHPILLTCTTRQTALLNCATVGSMTMLVGRAFQCTIVLGKKPYMKLAGKPDLSSPEDERIAVVPTHSEQV